MKKPWKSRVYGTGRVRRKQKAAGASAPTALTETDEMQSLFAGAPKAGALR